MSTKEKMNTKNKILFILGCISIASLVFFFIITQLYVIGGIFFGFCVIAATISSLVEKYETKCSKCKTPYDYDTDVSFKELKRWTTGPSSTVSVANGSYAQLFYKIEFNCCCSNCGVTKRYIKKIAGPRITQNGDYEDVDVVASIESKFKKKEATGGQAVLLSLGMIVFSLACIFGGILLRVMFGA